MLQKYVYICITVSCYYVYVSFIICTIYDIYITETFAIHMREAMNP